MKSSFPQRDAIVAQGRHLAILRGLLEDAGSDTIKTCAARPQSPRGTAMSVLTRETFIRLAQGSHELAQAGVLVQPRGEFWVRVLLPLDQPRWIKLRKRPSNVIEDAGTGLLSDEELDLLGGPAFGEPVLFWDWNYEEGKLAHFSVAWPKAMSNWYDACQVYWEIDITADLVALPAASAVPAGARNDDDNLDDIVGRFDDNVMSEDEATDKMDEALNDRTDPAVGEDDL